MQILTANHVGRGWLRGRVGQAAYAIERHDRSREGTNCCLSLGAPAALTRVCESCAGRRLKPEHCERIGRSAKRPRLIWALPRNESRVGVFGRRVPPKNESLDRGGCWPGLPGNASTPRVHSRICESIGRRGVAFPRPGRQGTRNSHQHSNESDTLISRLIGG
jgi:hypothetical protein